MRQEHKKLLRLVITALLVFVGGLSLWVYLIAALIMPKESSLWK